MELQRTEQSKQTMKKKQNRKKTSRFVPYAVGFKPPSKSSQLKAIGFQSNTIQSAFTASPDFFQPVPHPTNIDDWLAQYAEEGQTYNQYLKECPWFSKRKVKYANQIFNPEGKRLAEKYPEGKIYIIPVGTFNKELVVFEDLIDYVQRFLCLPVATLPNLTLDDTNGKVIVVEKPTDSTEVATKRTRCLSSRVKRTELVTRHNSKSGHMQIRVDSILSKLRQNIPKDALCLIALTSHDLYGDNTDLFVAGMAAGNQRVAIFSFFRYDPSLTFSKEFWHQIYKSKVVSEKEKKRLILQRSCKLLVHEISHLLGIGHCVYFNCCMNGSGHLSEDFRQPMHLCPVDLHKLEALCGFHAVQRYESLLEFYKRHQLHDEADWVERRINSIQSTV